MKRDLTKTQIIKEVRERVGELYPFGGQWKYNYWPDGVNRSGRESHPTDYHSAKHSRSQLMIELANDDGTEYRGGRWTDYVK